MFRQWSGKKYKGESIRKDVQSCYELNNENIRYFLNTSGNYWGNVIWQNLSKSKCTARPNNSKPGK